MPRIVSNVFPFFIACILLTSATHSQRRISDLRGYQDYLFGESRSKVESHLKKESAAFADANETEIVVKTQVDLENVLLPITLEKRFEFFHSKLWCVTLRYQEPVLISRTDSVRAAILRQLYQKYGRAQQDTTMPDEKITVRFLRWDFPSGYVVFNSMTFAESLKSQLPGVIADQITVSYSQRGISELIELEKRKKTAKEF